MANNTIYERHFLQRKHGFPLWIPHPNIRLPKSYVDKGVSVGDVGIITQYGAFDYLFNICLPAEHPSNAGPLPEGFVPLLTQQKDISEFLEYTPGSYISSASVQKLQGLSFESTGNEGAVLTMPDGASHEDIRHLSKFREYAALHANSWYKYANGTMGREIENGELHLVTGCDKTSAWGIATFSGHGVSQDSPHLITFNTEQGPDGLTCSWDHSGQVDVKACPASPLSPQDRLRNQCTFLRSHTVSLSEEEWAKLMSAISTPSGEITETTSSDTVSKISSKSRNTFRRFLSSFGEGDLVHHYSCTPKWISNMELQLRKEVGVPRNRLVSR